MYSNISPTDRSLHGGYVPYFYYRGLHLSYGLSATHAPGDMLNTARSDYDFSSDAPRRGLLDHPQTVEQIIAHGYLVVPDSAPETAILTDKGQTSWLGLDDLIRQVRSRYQIYQKNMYEIEQAKCSAVNTLLSVVASRGNVAPSSKEAYGVNKVLQKLYERQMSERVQLWQDISRLKLVLPESAQSYLSAYRKLSVLGSGGDGQ